MNNAKEIILQSIPHENCSARSLHRLPETTKTQEANTATKERWDDHQSRHLIFSPSLDAIFHLTRNTNSLS